MQAPELARSSSKGKTGYIVALAGSILSLLSFHVFPFISIVLLGPYTLSQILQLAEKLGSPGSSSGVTPISETVGLIWLSLIVAIIAGIVALVFTIRANSHAVGAVSLIILGVVGSGIFLYMINKVNVPPYISIGAGAWLCVFGMIAAAVGGIVALTGHSSA